MPLILISSPCPVFYCLSYNTYSSKSHNVIHTIIKHSNLQLWQNVIMMIYSHKPESPEPTLRLQDSFSFLDCSIRWILFILTCCHRDSAGRQLQCPVSTRSPTLHTLTPHMKHWWSPASLQLRQIKSISYKQVIRVMIHIISTKCNTNISPGTTWAIRLMVLY